ncbi:separin protein [Coemansia sp. RSA 2336]|nr:separin protein [Coemansia sp. RSA 2336]
MSDDLLSFFNDPLKCTEKTEQTVLEQLSLAKATVARTDIEFALSVVNQSNQLFAKQAAEIRKQAEKGEDRVFMKCVERIVCIGLAAFRYLHKHRSKAGFSVLTLEKTLSNFTIACTNAHLGAMVWDSLQFQRELLLEHARTHTIANGSSAGGSDPTTSRSRPVRKPAARNARTTKAASAKPTAPTQRRSAEDSITRGINRLSISRNADGSDGSSGTQFPIHFCQSNHMFNMLVVTMLCNILRVLAQAPAASDLIKNALDALSKRQHSAFEWCLRVQKADKDAIEPLLAACFRAYYTLGGVSDRRSLGIRLLAIQSYAHTSKCDYRELLKYASRAAARAEPLLCASVSKDSAYKSLATYYSQVLELVRSRLADMSVSPELVEFVHHFAQIQQRADGVKACLAACRLTAGTKIGDFASELIGIDAWIRVTVQRTNNSATDSPFADDLTPLIDAALSEDARYTLSEWNALAQCADNIYKTAKTVYSTLQDGHSRVLKKLVNALDAACVVYKLFISRGAAAKAESAGGTSVAGFYNRNADAAVLLIQIVLRSLDSDSEAYAAAIAQGSRLLEICRSGKCNADHLRNHSTVFFNHGANLYQLKLYSKAVVEIELAISSLQIWIKQACSKGTPLGNTVEQLCKRFEVAAMAYQSDRLFAKAAQVYGRAASWIAEHAGDALVGSIYTDAKRTVTLPPFSSRCNQGADNERFQKFIKRYVRMNAERLLKDPLEKECLVSLQKYMPVPLSNAALCGWFYEAEAYFWRLFITSTSRVALKVQEARLLQALEIYETTAPVGYARALVNLARVSRDKGDIEACRDWLHAAMEVAKSQSESSVYVVETIAECYAWQAVVQLETDGNAASEISACIRLWSLVHKLASEDKSQIDAGFMGEAVGLMQQLAELLLSRRLFVPSADMLHTALDMASLCEHRDGSWAPIVVQILVGLGSAYLLQGDSNSATEYFSDAIKRYESGVLPAHIELSAKISYASFQLACGDSDGATATMQKASEQAQTALSSSRRDPSQSKREAASPDTLVLLSKASYVYSMLALQQGALADAVDLGVHGYRILNSLVRSLSLAHKRAMYAIEKPSGIDDDDPFASQKPNEDTRSEPEYTAFGGNWELQRLLIDVLAHLAQVHSVRGSVKEVEYFLGKALDLAVQLQAPFQQSRLQYIESNILARKSLRNECVSTLSKLCQDTTADDRGLLDRGLAEVVSLLMLEGDSWMRCGDFSQAQTAYTEAMRFIEALDKGTAKRQDVVKLVEATPRLQRILSRIKPDPDSAKADVREVPLPISLVCEDLAIRKQLIFAMSDSETEQTLNSLTEPGGEPAHGRSLDQQPEYLLLRCKLAFVELERALAEEQAWSMVLQSALMFPAVQSARAFKLRKGSGKAVVRDQLLELDVQLLRTIEVAITIGSAYTVHEASHLLALVKAMQGSFGLTEQNTGIAEVISNIIEDCRSITVVREVLDAMRRRNEPVPAKLTTWPNELISNASATDRNSNVRSEPLDLRGSPVLKARSGRHGSLTSALPLQASIDMPLSVSSEDSEANGGTAESDAIVQAVDGKRVVAKWTDAIATADQSEGQRSVESLSAMLPENWVVCGLSIDQTRNMLLVTRYEHGQQSIALCLPMRAVSTSDYLSDSNSDDAPESIFEDAYSKLQEIIAESDKTMKTGSLCATETDKRAWWETRSSLDQRLGALLSSIENQWLGGFKHVLDPTLEFSASGDISQLRATISECVAKGLTKSQATKVRNLQLSAEICMLVFWASQKSRLSARDSDDDEANSDWQDVCSLVWDSYFYQGATPQSNEDTLKLFAERLDKALGELDSVDSGREANRKQLILVLDKHAQQIPWECLPCIRNFPISRMPSIALLRQRIQSINRPAARNQFDDCLSDRCLDMPLLAPNSTHSRALSPESAGTQQLPTLSSLTFEENYLSKDAAAVAGAKASGKRVFYVLNPEGDLRRTQGNFEAYLTGQPGWSGVVGRRPMNSEYEHGLKTSDIFMYFGHGGGEGYISRSQIRMLDRCAVALLLGCSSGQLKFAGEYDALGTATDYMIGGCPALVGNLWDVGDKDIDRFAASLLQVWGLAQFSPASIDVALDAKSSSQQPACPDKPVSLAEAVCWARRACRMAYLTGAAPVVYGIPVYLE